MAAIFAFTCSSCGDIHEGSPSFAFRAPRQYASLSEEQKSQMGSLTSDFCTITHDEGTDYFVRAILEVPIHGIEDPFLWGIWVSLSEQSFARYRETYDDNARAGEGFFGWVSNDIPVYPYAQSRPSNVVMQPGGNRPTVTLHHSDLPDDPLSIDQAQGITVAKAEELAERTQHGS
jgi:hypothetical protein